MFFNLLYDADFLGVKMSSRLLWLAVLLFLVVPVAAMAQATPAPAAAATGTAATATGAAATSVTTVHGMVVDPDDALIPGATVTLTPSSGKAQSTTSKSDGSYSFRGVAAGTYTLTVKAPGFASFVKPGIKVTAGANLNQDATLAIQEAQQEMNVTADTVTLSVDPDNNASSTVITGAALDALPDDPDDLEAELTALAGPSAGPNGGQIYIDGFTGGQLPPKSSILAIRINQNPFSAQYDQPGYGRVEIITKPGTDQYHGFFTAQYNDKALNTSTPFLGPANYQPDYHTLFFMGNVTGPIRKGMSYTLSGSHRTMDNNQIINPPAFYSNSPTSVVLCAPGDLTCTSNPFPDADRALATPATRWDVSPRLDMMLGAKNTLTARYQYESGVNRVNPAVDSALLMTGSDSYSNEQEIQISETQLISSKVINETRFEYQHSSSHSSPLNTAPGVSVSGGFGVGGGTIGYGTGDQIEIQNYTSVQLTKNFVRFGGRLRTESNNNFSNGGVNGSFSYTALLDPCTDPNVPMANKPSNCVFTSVAPQSSDLPGQICAANSTSTPVSSYQCGVANQFSYTAYTTPLIRAKETDLGLYAEDDWKATPNLTFSYGVRLETQNVINSNHDIAPRTSIAYGIPRKNGKTTTVLRGGFGVFYNRFGLGSIQSQIAHNGLNSQSYTYSTPNANCQPTSTGYSSGCTVGVGTAATVTPTVNDPALRSAYIVQSAGTVEQQIGKYASVSVTYLNARGYHQFETLRIPTASSNGLQINNVNQSSGIFRQNQINTNINVRTPKGISVFGYYSANWANTNDSSITDPFSTTVDYGRARYGVRSRLFLGGSIPLPYHLSASPMLSAQSGSPYNLTVGTPDRVTLGGNDRPAFAPGVTAATADCRVQSDFADSHYYAGDPTNNQVPINFCTGPASVSFNLRLGRTFGFGPKTAAALAAAAQQAAQQQGGGPGGPGGPGGGRGEGGGGGRGGGGGGGRGGGGGGGRGGGGGNGSNTGRKYNLTLSAQAFNLFNEVPYSNPIGTWKNPQFGQTTSIQGGNNVRRIILQASFNF
jgi:hypothetical protein